MELILTQPNDIFLAPAHKAEAIGETEREVLYDLFEVASGLDAPILAATQIGHSLNVFLRMDEQGIPNFFFNPRVTWQHPDKVSKNEQGLSYPRPMWKTRPKAIRLTYDIFQAGGKETASVMFMGDEARYVIQMVELLNGGAV